MDKELFKKTEGLLYGYFKDINILAAVKLEIETVSNIIQMIEENIKKCNIEVDPYQPGIPNSERVQCSSSNNSYVEKEIIKAIDDMEKEKAQRTRKLYKLLHDERNLEYKIQKIECILKRFNEESKRFIELKYNNIPNNKIGMRDIAFELNMSKNKAYDLRNEIIEIVAGYRINYI